MGAHRRSPARSARSARSARWAAAAGSGLALGAALLPVTATAADKNCDDFRYQEDAQAVLAADRDDPNNLDDDNDNRACESLPSRGSSSSSDDDSRTTKASTGTRSSDAASDVDVTPVGAADTGDGSSL